MPTSAAAAGTAAPVATAAVFMAVVGVAKASVAEASATMGPAGPRPSASTTAPSIFDQARSIRAVSSRLRIRATTGSRVLSENLISLLPTMAIRCAGTRFLNRKTPLSGCRFGVPNAWTIVYRRCVPTVVRNEA